MNTSIFKLKYCYKMQNCSQSPPEILGNRERAIAGASQPWPDLAERTGFD
jgi:hypothetical protein